MAKKDSTGKKDAKQGGFLGTVKTLLKYWHMRIWLIVFAFLLVVVIVASCVINYVPLISVTLDQVFGGQSLKLSGPTEKYQYYTTTDSEESEALTYYDLTNGGISKKSEALAAADELNQEICEEGFVLLKNENSALPIATPVSDTTVTSKPKVTVFGKSSVNLVYGSTGSGGSDHTGAVSIYDSLVAAGFEYNPTMKSFYDSTSLSGSGRNDNADMEQGVSVGLAHGETPWSSYGTAQTSSFSEYGDAAIVVFSRTGGEGWDLPRTMKKTAAGGDDDTNKVDGAFSATDHYLELDENEQDLLLNVCDSFDKVIVVINSSTPMELGFLDSTDDNDSSARSGMSSINSKIQAAIWMGAPGNTGVMSLGRILNGQVNPSGRLVDTYERQMELSPTWKNFSTNMDDLTAGGLGDEYVTGTSGSRSGYYYVDYEEGIYVGYRYYETAYYESLQNNYSGFDYDSQVVFPFGYGLSYTTFSWEIESEGTTDAITQNMLDSNEDITINVTVTNTGKVAGKDVVEAYCTAPYTEGGIEKAYVTLAGYAKTSLLQPGDSETVTISFSPYSLASYDYSDANSNGHKGYELDCGEYVISLAQNAHQAAVGTTAGALQQKYTIATSIANDENGIAYNYDSDPDGKEGNKVENQFDDVSYGSTDSAGTNISERTMSRSDFAGTFPTTPTIEDRTVTQDYLDEFDWSWSTRNDEDKDYYTETAPTFAASATGNTDIQLYELIGKDLDDSLWDDFLEQLTVEEMSQLIGMGCYSTISNTRIGLPSSTSADGPVGLVNFFSSTVDLGQKGTVYDVCSYASECVVAATWNDELVYEEGVSLGNECLIGNEDGDGKAYTGWYAPGVNIHRTPFSGRNSEYYSEDSTLAGNMAANVVKGAISKGVTPMVKHFAVNDQETHRQANGISAWLTEQSLREIYLRPFQYAVEKGGSMGIMSSFNRIGTTWAGGSYELLTEVLRNEWGFEGMVITDFNTDNTTYMNVDQMIRAGGDLDLAQDKQPSLVSKKGEDRLTPTQASLIQQAARNILYVLANSNVMNGIGEGVTMGMGLSGWQTVNLWVGVGIGIALIVWGGVAVFLTLRKDKRLSAEAESQGTASGSAAPAKGNPEDKA